MGINRQSTWKPDHQTVSSYFYVCAAGLLLTGAVNLLLDKTSLLRLVLFASAILAAAALYFLGRQIRVGTSGWVEYVNGQKSRVVLTLLSSIGFLGGWYIIWTPLDNFGKYFYYLQGALSFFIWLLLASGVGLFLLLAAQQGIQPRQWLAELRSDRKQIIFITAVLAIFAILAAAARLRVVGMQPENEGFWYGAGVPVLIFQVFAALILGLGLAWGIEKLLAKFSLKTLFVDALLFVLLWGISGWLWAREPVKPDFLINQPVAPNYELYPDYDARNYDIMSQFALIGQGINNRTFFDRVLYPAFLTYLHTYVGQDYAHVMAVQAAMFAIIPALIFLIGSAIYSRGAGLSLALLTALRGVNAINVGNIINTSHQKQMLTEFPTTVLLVVATYLLIKWMQNPTKNWTMAGLAGMVIGLSTLVRPHTLMVIPIFLGISFLVYRHKTRMWVGVSAFFFAAALFSVMPWVQFGGQDVTLFSLYSARIENVIQERYPQLFPRPSGSGQQTPQNASHIAELSSSSFKGKSIWAFTADNLLNNLVTSVQILPATPFNLDAHTVVKKTEDYWKQYWDGSLSGWAIAFTIVNLLLLATGLAAAWKKARWIGMLPLIIMLGYYLANSLGRTSGGRYLVPADWAVVIYYVFGLIAVLEIFTKLFIFTGKAANPETPKVTSFEMRPWWLGAIAVLTVSAALGSTIPLSQTLNSLRFQKVDSKQLVDIFTEAAGSKLSLTSDQLNTFLSSKDAIILSGRSLYPRQFAKDEGLDISVYSFYHPLPYPRTLFTVLGSQGQQVVILARTDAAKISNAGDVMVVGCQSDGYVLAWAVLRLDDKSLFERTPGGAPLTCPLPTPVCDNNKSCH